ncbi:hypothetical protein F383_37705 [Gossypium arboreum]|nr:hypothetical protein F383_37705 [Gossypium arboreum]
MRVCECS